MVYGCIGTSNGRNGFNLTASQQTIFDYNCYFGNTGAQLGGSLIPGTHDVTSDPLMIDPGNATASLRNFGLQATSPCLGVGGFAVPGSAT